MKVHKLVNLTNMLNGRTNYEGNLSNHTGVCEAGKNASNGEKEFYAMFPYRR